MTETRFARVQALFEDAVALPQASRRSFLRSACGDDEALFDEVAAIVDADAHDGGILDGGVTEVPGGAPVSSPQELTPSTVLSDYEIVECIGTGGFGSVYKARHVVIGKLAAIKVLHPEHAHSPALTQRFVNEARAVNEIGHPNIIDVFGFGQTDDGRQYSIMEFVDAPSLADVLQTQERFELVDALPILRGLAAALDAAHAHGVVHRDLKPANVLVQRPEDGPATVKLVDFGIAKLRPDAAWAEGTTQTGQLLGTPAYMSPELIRGQAVDGKADAYAFGVLAYRVLTGRLPFTADNAFELLVQHTESPPPRPSSAVPKLGPNVDAVVLALLAKDPTQRPEPLLEALERLETHAPVAGATESSRPRGPVLVGVAAALTAAGTLWWAWPPREPPPARPAAARSPASRPSAPARTPAAVAAPLPSPAAPVPTVALEIRGAPKGTRVFDADNRELGAAPGTIAVPSADAPITLRFVHPKRGTQSVEVEPDRDRTVQLHWPAAPRKKTGRALHQDLETPF